jgi:hypothetical protein
VKLLKHLNEFCRKHERILTLSLNSLVAIAAIWAASAATAANQNAREQFQRDQRPYVWLTNEPEALDWTKLENRPVLTWPLHYTNYGKSPAYNIKLHVALEVVLVNGERNSANVISKGAPLPPNKQDLLLAVSSTDVTPEEFQRLRLVDGGVRAFGLIEYQDSSDTTYETRFCLRHRANGKADYCDTNSMK